VALVPIATYRVQLHGEFGFDAPAAPPTDPLWLIGVFALVGGTLQTPVTFDTASTPKSWAAPGLPTQTRERPPRHAPGLGQGGLTQIPDSSTVEFFGVIADTGFSSVIVQEGTQGGNMETYYLDDLVYSYYETPNANNPVPEPGTMLLFGTGLAGVVAWRLKKSQA